MSRRDDDRFDDEDDILSERQRKAKTGFPVWAIVLLCAVPIVAVLVIGGAVAMFTVRAAHVERAQAEVAQNEAMVRAADGPAMRAQGPAEQNKDGAKRVYPRDEFRALLGSSPEVVNAKIGPPEFRTKEGARVTWHYHNTSTNTATGKVDPVTKVVFADEVVVEINAGQWTVTRTKQVGADK